MKTFTQCMAWMFVALVTQHTFAQTLQTVKGQITDRESKFPLMGVTVAVISTNPIAGAATDENGEFKIIGIPVGRHTIKVSYLGYKEQIIPNVVVNAGKETIVDFQLVENVITTDEIVVRGAADKTATNNEMTVVSARSFNLEEAQRYAGSLNDPARMAANFAGVSGGDDARNDIVIRGNSPLGLLWRLEGIEIPNPNHFGSLGTTGGPVSILNTNQLGKSDFMTSAFPANFGNATSGVFDLALRRPNNEKREHMFQIGFNGFEAGTEGPFVKGKKASYMINYRYSTLGVFKALGVEFGTGAAIPQYQDISLKVELPTKKWGKFVIFGLGGLSNIEFYDSKIDTSNKNNNFYNDGTQDILFRSNMGVAGVSHTYFFNSNVSSKLVLAISGTEQPTNVDTIIRTPNAIKLFKNYEGNYRTTRSSVNYSVNYKLNKRNTLNTGLNVDIIGFSLKDKAAFGDTTNTLITIRDSEGSNTLVQTWAQWQHKFSDRVIANVGLHHQYFSLNGQHVAEPRGGIKFQATEKLAFNAGAGIHHQTQPVFVYYTRTRVPGTNEVLPELTNKNLKFTQSNHVVVGADYNLAKNWRIKTEVYYQALRNIPVETQSSSFSMVNIGADFNIPSVDSLVNKGTGFNYGYELTLERFFNNGFYLLGTASLFESKYKGSDGVERNTAFNGNYVLNALGGYEFNVGAKNVVSINLRTTWAGGRRYTPVDAEASMAQKRTVRDDKLAFSAQLPDYFRTDATIGYRREGKKISQQFLLQINNVTNHFNVFQRRYSILDNKVVDVPQQMLLIIPQFRILF